MKRTHFISTIVGYFGLSVLPLTLLKQYQKIYLLQCFVRGFKFYEGPHLLLSMKQDDMLELVREPNNLHDECAIALHYNNQKIGFIPAEENELLSRLLDANVVELMAEITHLEADAATWENVSVAIYVLKEDTALTPQASYLTTLQTPSYYSLKHSSTQFSRIYAKGNDIMNGEDFYAALVKNSANDGVYSLIHNDIGDPKDLEALVNENLLVINTEKLPANLKTDTVIQALEEGVIKLTDAFDTNGYVVAQIDRVAQLSARIEKFAQVTDKSGRQFWEVVFRE